MSVEQARAGLARKRAERIITGKLGGNDAWKALETRRQTPGARPIRLEPLDVFSQPRDWGEGATRGPGQRKSSDG